SHSVEVKLEALPMGRYAIVVSENKNFDGNQGQVGYLITHVSNIGFWKRSGDGSGTSFVVFNRQSGAPVEKAEVEFWVRSYNSITHRYQYKKRETRLTDADGFVTAPFHSGTNRNFSIIIKKDGDVLTLDRHFYNDYYTSEKHGYQRTVFFLDRGIYRPGQTVYFKGIALYFDTEQMPAILKGQPVTVTLRDANYQEVSKLELRTNQYGTFSGQFVTPRGGLSGNMQIVSSIGGNAKSFRVEEYKRPKFEVKFEPPNKSYRLNDTVVITGSARAYAGNKIDGARVSWRVVRQTRFPWYWSPWRWMPRQSETMEIAHGTTITGENGQFELAFPALPDNSIGADKKPLFDFTVYADVTDITGETQSNQTTVKVGFISMEIDVPVEKQMNLDSLNKLTLITKNLNGEFEPAKGSIKLERLKTPNHIYIDRYWQPADRRVMAEADFRKNFPHFPWTNENHPEAWPVQRSILKENFNTDISKEILLPKSKLQPGWYAITVLTKDRYGEKTELKKYFSLFDLNSKTPPTPTLLWHFLQNKQYEPDTTAPTHFGTSRNRQPVLIEYMKDDRILERKWLNVNNLKSNIFEIKEMHRGGIGYVFSYAGSNRSFNNKQNIRVPWSNKQLSVELTSFRDKLQPGQQEEWTVKIKGPKGEKVAAEMVAALYDASLDAFVPNNWNMDLFPMSWLKISYESNGYSSVRQSNLTYFHNDHLHTRLIRTYDQLNWFNWHFGYHIVREYQLLETRAAPMAATEDSAGYKNKKVSAVLPADGQLPPPKKKTEAKPSPPTAGGDLPIRTNLDETVFFFPHLMTDDEGNILIKFKMNEALTRWKFLGLAHTQDLKTGTITREVVTQKDLMVVPNPPRFFRENDIIEFTAKVVNLTQRPLSGNAELQLVNPLNSLPVYKWLDNPQFNVRFNVKPGQSTRVAWRFKVPDVAEVPLIEHTVLAVAGHFSDGERAIAPVVSNRMLVTETKPLPVRGRETKTFVFDRLKNNHSPTLRHQGLTLEFTQNPAWYAVQALPYLMEFPYECTEQIFNRYYANSLATSVANSHPKIKAVFDKWRKYEPDALLSKLSKNQELKTALLEETPWVLQAQSEELQKQNIALLFDLNRMAYEQELTLKKLRDRQMPGGGWSWFPGGTDSWYITQYLVQGFGHLQKLNAAGIGQGSTNRNMIKKAVRYCDERMVEQYEELEQWVKEGKTTWDDDHLNYMAAHYLYARSFFLKKNNTRDHSDKPDNDQEGYIPLNGKALQVHQYYIGQAEKHWLGKGIYTEGMLALALFRSNKKESAQKIIRSLDERSLNHEELGKYWKYPSGWWWYQAPIETQALMIEAFNEVANDAKAVDELKVWLLKNKQTNHWKTTKATASAVYALLSTGDNWLLDNTPLDIHLGKKKNPEWNTRLKEAQNKAEAGTGYFKIRFDGEEINPEMGTIKIANPNNVVAWGALYWQYFEQLDKITTFEETPLTLKKKLFRVENTDRGEVIHPVEKGEKLKVGQKLKVRIELRVDRDMEYVHLKDMRAGGLEPVNVISQYKWQDGLGYYESTRDVATHFFFSRLPKGTYVFEYPLWVQHKGNFSNGNTTIQCMYAPEFTSHSEGIRIFVGD
ncbi:MAG TPA: hypothetical protein ENJ20_05480, partial [Bacteroidetes bacterium]|nr:hypothetical protein [Bacteroidota bacterium]